MRGLISGICVAGALLLTAASMFMNWSFWTGQGGDASASQVLGAVSIGIDVFKATLPLVIASAWSARLRLGCSIGIMFFGSNSHYGCDLGLGATNRIDGRLNAIEKLREL